MRKIFCILSFIILGIVVSGCQGLDFSNNEISKEDDNEDKWSTHECYFAENESDSCLVKVVELEEGLALYELRLLDKRTANMWLEGAEALENKADVYFLDSNHYSLLLFKEDEQFYLGHFLYFKELKQSPPLNTIEGLESVEIRLEKEAFTLSTESISTTVFNDSVYLISMGSDYVIEYFDGSQWLELPFSPGWAFTSMLYTLQPQESLKFDVWLVAYATVIFDYEPGLYRIRKPIFIGDSSSFEEVHDLVVEFYLK